MTNARNYETGVMAMATALHGFLSIGGLLWMAFVGWMLHDSISVQNNNTWVYIILFFQPIGPLIYFIVHKLPDFDLTRRINALWASRRRIRELRAKIHHMDLPLHWAELGDEHALRGDWPKAAHCYEEALRRDPRSEEAHYGLGQARLALGQFEEARHELEPVVAAKPRYAYGEAMLALARAWRGLGRAEEALETYEAVLRNHTYYHVRYEYADMLFEQDRAEESLRIMHELYEDGRNATGFSRVMERRWGRKAGRFLRQHSQPRTPAVVR